MATLSFGREDYQIRNGGFEMEDRSMSVEEYAQLLENFVCQNWQWPDFICFARDHGHAEEDVEEIRKTINAD